MVAKVRGGITARKGVFTSPLVNDDDLLNALTRIEQERNVRIIRIDEVMERVQLSRSTIWRLEKAGKFPVRKRLGTKAMGWSEEDIDMWIKTRPSSLAF
jgi:prophage regulatory protein